MAVAGLEAAKKYEAEALERIRRMGLAAADLEVRGTKRHGLAAPAAMTEDRWFDDGPVFPAMQNAV